MISLKLRLLNEDIDKDELIQINNKDENNIGENSVIEPLIGDMHQASRISEPIISPDHLSML